MKPTSDMIKSLLHAKGRGVWQSRQEVLRAYCPHIYTVFLEWYLISGSACCLAGFNRIILHRPDPYVHAYVHTYLHPLCFMTFHTVNNFTSGLILGVFSY